MALNDGRPSGYPDTQELVQVQFDDPEVAPYRRVPLGRIVATQPEPGLQNELDAICDAAVRAADEGSASGEPREATGLRTARVALVDHDAQLTSIWEKLGTPLPPSAQAPRLLESKDLSDGRPGDEQFHPHVSLRRY